ncbi:MAG: prepilin-type N-terminal cleavage/methylation domain-containing protein [Desulfobacterales bacterium]|jgi:general secretion pathway protein I
MMPEITEQCRPDSGRAGGLVRRDRQRGVTLLEVMVALGIAAVVLVAVYRLQMQSIAMERITQFHTQAPLLAQQLVAEIELQIADLPATDSGDFGEDFPDYTWSLEATDVEAFSDPEGRSLLKQIDLEVYLNRDEDRFALRTYRLVPLDS